MTNTHCIAIGMIYTFLLRKNHVTSYDFINIIEVGNELNELISVDKREVHINIRYFIQGEYQSRSLEERNAIRLNSIHTAMLRLAEQDSRVDVDVLHLIRSEILEKNFLFYFEHKKWTRKLAPVMTASLLFCPKENKIDFFIILFSKGIEVCNKLVYSGRLGLDYLDTLFCHGKWSKENNFMLTGKSKEIEFIVFPEACKVAYVNHSNWPVPPTFDSLRSSISPALPEPKDEEYENWFYSLPPTWIEYFFDLAAKMPNAFPKHRGW